MSYISNEISEDEKLFEVHTSYSESLEKNIRQNKKLCQCDVDENKNSIIQQNDKVITLFNQQFRNAKTIILRL